MNEDQFFKFIYDLAKKHGSKFPELVAGQASLESAYGKRKPNQFNVFGQTATSSQPHNVVNNRKWRNYGSFDEAVKDHLRLWEGKRKGKDSISALKSYVNSYAPPSENQNYVGKMTAILKKHNAIQGNVPNQSPSKSKPMDEELLQEWKNYNNEIASARKSFSGSELDKAENKIIKKYTDKGYIGKDSNGEATGAFNNLIMNINKNRWRTDKTKTEATFRVANNLEKILGDSQNSYVEKDGKQYFSKDSGLNFSSELTDQDKKDLEIVMGEKIDFSKPIPTNNFLKKIQSKLNNHLPEGQKINLINEKTNQRGKDLAIEVGAQYGNVKDAAKSGEKKYMGKIFIPDLAAGDSGTKILGIGSTDYNRRQFKYNPNNTNYKKLNYITPGSNWEIDDTTLDETVTEANTTTDPYVESSAPEYTNNNYNPNLKYNSLPDGSAENKRLAELGQKDKAKWTAAEKEEFDKLSKQQEDQSGIDKMMKSFADAEAPTQYNYDPESYKQSVPLAEMASSMFGIMTGMDMAETPLPERNEQVSSAYMSYAGELQRLSEIGLRPEDEAYAKRMLSESYSSGVEQIVHASGGNRNLVLGNLGRLDYQKQRGLLEIALADANAKNESFYKYGEAMKYISEFDANRDVANNERKYQNAMLSKEAGGQLMASGWKSLMDNIDYYKQNKPGSANHAYKSYMMQKMFDFDPNKKDDGSGTIPGTKSYKDKQDKENLIRYTQSKEMGEQYGNLSPEKKIEFNRIAMQKGYGNESKGLLSFLSKNDISAQADLTKYNEAKQSGDWSSLFSNGEKSQENPSILNQEIKTPEKMFAATPNEMTAFEKTKNASVKVNPTSEVKNPGINFTEAKLPNYDLIPKKENNLGNDLFGNIEKQAQQNQNKKVEVESFLQNQEGVINTVLQDQQTIEEQNKMFRKLLNN